MLKITCQRVFCSKEQRKGRRLRSAKVVWICKSESYEIWRSRWPFWVALFAVWFFALLVGIAWCPKKSKYWVMEEKLALSKWPHDLILVVVSFVWLKDLVLTTRCDIYLICYYWSTEPFSQQKVLIALEIFWIRMSQTCAFPMVPKPLAGHWIGAGALLGKLWFLSELCW